MPPTKRAKTASGATPTATSTNGSSHERPRVPVIPLDLAWVKAARVNPAGVNRAAAAPRYLL